MTKTVSVDAAATPRSPSSRSRSRHALRPRAAPATLATLLAVLVLGANAALASPALAGRDASTARTQQCRGGCFEKFATKETLCQQSAECLTCWDECAKPPPSKINKSIRETWSLHTVSMLQQDSLVLVDVAWAPLSSPNQCLVTWEVSGGGLMGNLLTESFNVQLSLWPDTKYRVQVTCKHKLTGSMSRSLPLTIDTAEAITPQERTQQQLQKQAAATTRLPNASSSSSTSDESSAEEESESRQGAAVDRLEPGLGSRLPFDDQSAETLNQHTNFVFNWHTKNSDISSIEPLHKPNALDVLSEATLSELQRPLLFGVVAGSLLLGLVLLLYVCVLRRQRLPGDKAALMADDVHSVVVSFPPSSCSKSSSSSSSSPSSSSASGSSSSSSLSAEEVCRNPETCSRNALKV